LESNSCDDILVGSGVAEGSVEWLVQTLKNKIDRMDWIGLEI
jgi:hypothetical protein